MTPGACYADVPIEVLQAKVSLDDNKQPMNPFTPFKTLKE